MAHKAASIKRQANCLQKQERLEKAALLLREHNVKHNAKQKTVCGKKRTHEDIAKLIPEMFYRESLFIRPADQWKSSSYNIERQVMDFVKWVYCKYPVPSFMLTIFLETHNTLRWFTIEYSIIFDWFIAIAQGKSLAKIAARDFTKKEAHLFLNGNPKYNVMDNIWRARIIAGGGSESLVNIMLRRAPDTFENKLWSELCKFMPRFESEITANNFLDVHDYLSHTFNHQFSFKGRTYSSLIKASNLWHRERHYKQHGNFDLKSMDVETWESLDKTNDCIWRIKQILTSKELYKEGSAMHHCVGGYAMGCKNGMHFIFSLTLDDKINCAERRVTIEVDKQRKVVQARGKFNRPLTPMEIKIITRWSIARNINFKNYY